jgi:hypothetical protein
MPLQQPALGSHGMSSTRNVEADSYHFMDRVLRPVESEVNVL